MSVEAYLARRAGVEFGEVSLGYRTVTLLAADEIAAEQQAYGGEGWEPSWLVIATEDELGDPIVTDLSVAKMPVFTLEHGEDEWTTVPIADSFDGFVRALQSVAALGGG